jgi:DNA polymerase delta subunit 4
MPPKRRASGPATKSQQQSTLAFHGASNKVTKAGPRPGAKKLLDDVAAPTKDVKPELEVIELIEEPTTEEAAIIDQTKEVVTAQKAQSTPEEDKARRISDAAIKKYWAGKEKQRTAPRVHQQDLSLHEKILREFDMSAQYGVSLALSGNMRCRLKCANMICAP